MALPNTTTAAAAIGKNDTTILFTAITDLVLGNLCKVDDEFVKIIAPLSLLTTTPQPVLRGQEGTAQVAHVTGAKIYLGANPSSSLAGDWGQPTPGGLAPTVMPLTRAKRRISYAAAGAITLPNPGEDMVATLVGTTILAMTVANPSKLADGDTLLIEGDGKAAHTVTYAAGVGNVGATADVFTFNAAQAQSFLLQAAGGFWNFVGAVAGAATIMGPGAG